MQGGHVFQLQVMKHRLGEHQNKDTCLLQEDKEDCFLALAMTDGAYVTINSNSKTTSEVTRAETNSTVSLLKPHSLINRLSLCHTCKMPEPKTLVVPVLCSKAT